MEEIGLRSTRVRTLDRTRAAENRVAGWRENNDLPFPDFSEAYVESIDNTVEYPPVGSVSRIPPEEDVDRSPDVSDM